MGLATAVRRAARIAATKAGQQATLRHRPKGTYDPTAMTVARAKLEELVWVVVEEYRQHQIGGNVRAGDRKVIVPALGRVESPPGLLEPPTEKDELVFGNDVWRAVTVDVVSVEGQPVIYQVQVRR